jgi:hypothetical protein
MISYVDIDTLETTTTDNGTNEIKKGASFQRIRGRIQYQHVKQHLGTLKQRAIQWEENAKRTAHDEANKLQEEERQLFHKFGVFSKHDIMKSSQLLEEAIGQFEDEMEEEIDGKIDQEIQQQGEEQQHYDEHWTSALVEWDKAVGQTDNNNREEGLVIGVGGSGSGIKKKYIGEENKRPGFIVLGMHRSGTSMLSGLLVEGFGYETGGPLIMPAFDNEKVRGIGLCDFHLTPSSFFFLTLFPYLLQSSNTRGFMNGLMSYFKMMSSSLHNTWDGVSMLSIMIVKRHYVTSYRDG